MRALLDSRPHRRARALPRPRGLLAFPRPPPARLVPLDAIPFGQNGVSGRLACGKRLGAAPILLDPGSSGRLRTRLPLTVSRIPALLMLALLATPVVAANVGPIDPPKHPERGIHQPPQQGEPERCHLRGRRRRTQHVVNDVTEDRRRRGLETMRTNEVAHELRVCVWLRRWQFQRRRKLGMMLVEAAPTL